MAREEIQTAQDTPNFTTTYYKRFEITPQQRQIIEDRVNESAPSAVRKRINTCRNFPQGGTIRVIPSSKNDNEAVIEVQKITGYSPEYNRTSIH